MKVTIGERLGIVASKIIDRRAEVFVDNDFPLREELQKQTVKLAECSSAKDQPCVSPGRYTDGCPCPYCKRRKRELEQQQVEDQGPRRVRGEMIWLHKTAPVLVIEGKEPLSPEEHAAGRRR